MKVYVKYFDNCCHCNLLYSDGLQTHFISIAYKKSKKIKWVWLFLNDDTVYARQGVTTNRCFSTGLSWGRLVVKNTVGHFPGGPRGCIEQHSSPRNRSTRPVWSLKT